MMSQYRIFASEFAPIPMSLLRSISSGSVKPSSKDAGQSDAAGASAPATPGLAALLSVKEKHSHKVEIPSTTDPGPDLCPTTILTHASPSSEGPFTLLLCPTCNGHKLPTAGGLRVRGRSCRPSLYSGLRFPPSHLSCPDTFKHT